MTPGSRSDGVLRKAGDGSAAAFAVIPGISASRTLHWPKHAHGAAVQTAVNAGHGDRRSRGWRGCRVIEQAASRKRDGPTRRNGGASVGHATSIASQPHFAKSWLVRSMYLNIPPLQLLAADLQSTTFPHAA